MSQSEMNSVLIVDFMNHNWVKKDSEIITYNGVINFPRAGKKEDRHCVMCGKLEKKDKCIIPNQNKDVCRKCDSSYWLMKEFNVVIKFCKGKLLTVLVSVMHNYLFSHLIMNLKMLCRLQNFFCSDEL